MKIWILCTALAIIALPLSAEVLMPDPNLQHAVRSALGLQPNQPITSANLQHLNRLVASKQGITDLTGLEHATQLEYLVLSGNDIVDLTPLTNLVALQHLALGENNITVLNALRGLINLKELHLSGNQITSVAALTRLTRLERLYLSDNAIIDVTPVATLTRLKHLEIYNNNIVDHSSLDNLSLIHYEYDQACESEALPLMPRLRNRQYPSVYAAFSVARNQPHISFVENMAQHDLHFSGIIFPVRHFETPHGWEIRGNTKRDPFELRDAFLAHNPNMVFLILLPLRAAWRHVYPADWPYWLRDAGGNIVSAGSSNDEGVNDGFIDFTHPGYQHQFVQQALAVAKCGLYDGIIIDWWNDHRPLLVTYDPYVEHRGIEAEMRAKINMMQQIRANARPEFLILANTNDNIIPVTGQYINGGVMEAIVPTTDESITRVRHSLHWLENNLRPPVLNLVEGGSNIGEPLESPVNHRLMRAFTTLGLTHSDGYVVFNIGNTTQHHWYDFWDADMGRPVEPKAQLYDEDTPGLYIREFTNGWAVYNHSGEAQVIMLPEKVQGVASGRVGAEHTLPNLDGEMYLRMKPENPADVNGDGVVNILDLVAVAQGLGTDNPEADVNGDGVVNVFDLVFVANEF